MSEIRLSRADRRALQKAMRQPGAPRRSPVPKLQDPMGYVIESMTLLENQEGGKYITTWKIRMHGAMHQVMKGEASRGDVNDLVAGWNITSALCVIYGMDDEILPRSKQALKDLCARSNQLKRVVAKATEITAINDLIVLHDRWVEAITVKEMEEALAWCKRTENECHLIMATDIPKW